MLRCVACVTLARLHTRTRARALFLCPRAAWPVQVICICWRPIRHVARPTLSAGAPHSVSPNHFSSPFFRPLPRPCSRASSLASCLHLPVPCNNSYFRVGCAPSRSTTRSSLLMSSLAVEKLAALPPSPTFPCSLLRAFVNSQPARGLPWTLASPSGSLSSHC